MIFEMSHKMIDSNLLNLLIDHMYSKHNAKKLYFHLKEGLIKLFTYLREI